VVPDDLAGWQSDRIGDGRTTLLTDGTDFDIIYKDAAQQTRSARFHDKATIFSRIGSSTFAGIVIVYVFYVGDSALVGEGDPTFVSEQYTFQLDERGAGVAALSQQKDAIVSKSALMAAPCSPDNG